MNLCRKKSNLSRKIGGIIILLSLLALSISFCTQKYEVPESSYTLSDGSLEINRFYLNKYDNIIPIDISGKWLFRTEDNPDFKNLSYPDSDWITLDTPLNWFNMPEDRVHTGYAWYRLHIIMPKEKPPGELGLRLGWIDDADQTYFNGHLIGHMGKFPDKPGETINAEHAYDRTRIYSIPRDIINWGSENILAIRINSMAYDTAGIYKGKMQLGSLILIQKDFMAVENTLIILAFVYFFIGLYHFYLFLKLKGTWENLLFALLSVVVGLISVSRGQIKYIFYDNFDVLKLMDYSLETIAVALFIHFVIFYFEKKPYNIFSIIVDFVVGFSLIYFFIAYPRVQLYYYISTYSTYWLMIGITIYTLIYLFLHRKSGSHAIQMLIGFALFGFTLVADVILMIFVINVPWISHYGFIAFIFSIASAIGSRFLKLYNDVNQKQNELNKLTENLEKEVVKRTDELNKSHEKIINEINERLIAEKKLKNTQIKLYQSERLAALGQMAGGIAHEINNPISFIYNSLDPLNKSINEITSLINSIEKDSNNRPESNSDAQISETVDSNIVKKKIDDIEFLMSAIKQGAQRISGIVKNMQHFSQGETESKQQTDINRNIEITISLLKNKIKNRIKITRDFCDNAFVFCNGGQIDQVILNLVINAVQAIEDTGEITIKTIKENEFFILQITDNGLGIPDEIIHRIFDPFFSTKPPDIGTGLGLSISYEIIKSHNGVISAKSHGKNKGTTFTVQLPV